MTIHAKIIPGYGAASGKNKDNRYPNGTIAEQAAYFKALGLDLSPYFLGTLNIDISPYSFELVKPKYFFEQIDWSEFISPENFYFFDVSLLYQTKTYKGLIYMPDPKTKEEHLQKTTTLELILPKIDGLVYGVDITVTIDPEQLKLKNLE
ncbi:MAG: hypothetical protein AAFZ89_09610 [Bacteroidota bacterium]